MLCSSCIFVLSLVTNVPTPTVLKRGFNVGTERENGDVSGWPRARASGSQRPGLHPCPVIGNSETRGGRLGPPRPCLSAMR